MILILDANGIKCRLLTLLHLYTLEETYEVLDAITVKILLIKRRVSDLLYQVVFYSRMAQDKSYLILTTFVTPLVRIERHPHIFLSESENNLSTENIAGKNLKHKSEAKAQFSLLDDIPITRALMKAEKKFRNDVASCWI